MLNDEPRTDLVAINLLQRIDDEDTPSQKVEILKLKNNFHSSSLIATSPDIIYLRGNDYHLFLLFKSTRGVIFND